MGMHVEVIGFSSFLLPCGFRNETHVSRDLPAEPSLLPNDHLEENLKLFFLTDILTYKE